MGRRSRPGARTTYKGTTYSSAFEAGIAADLTQRGVAFEYESRSIFYELPKLYRPDFVIGDMIVEIKGFFPPGGSTQDD